MDLRAKEVRAFRMAFSSKDCLADATISCALATWEAASKDLLAAKKYSMSCSRLRLRGRLSSEEVGESGAGGEVAILH